MCKGYCKDDFKLLGMVILNAIYRVINVYFLLNKKIIMCLIMFWTSFNKAYNMLRKNSIEE